MICWRSGAARRWRLLLLAATAALVGVAGAVGGALLEAEGAEARQLAAPVSLRLGRQLLHERGSFSDTLRSEAQRIGQLPATGASCDLPYASVVLRYTNSYHFDLLLAQQSAMLDAGLACVLPRVLTVCLDEKCLALCSRHRIRNCLLFSEARLHASDFSEGDYYRILFLKWRLLSIVTDAGVDALFVDDDVLVLRNPFFGVRSTPYDVQYQTESGDGCNAQPNGGVMFVRSTDAGRRFLSRMIARRDAIVNGNLTLLDQDMVLPAVAEAGARACALPKRQYAGHCAAAHEASASTRDAVTYHAHCCATKRGKLALMERIQRSVATGGDSFRIVDEGLLLPPARVPLLTRILGMGKRASVLDDRLCFSEQVANALMAAHAPRPVLSGGWQARRGWGLRGGGHDDAESSSRLVSRSRRLFDGSGADSAER